MKFRDGYWGLKEGVTLLSAIEVRDIAQCEGELTVYSMCKGFRHRGDTLNAPVITTVYSSPMPDVIHVRSFHFKGGIDRGPWFDLTADHADSMSIEETADSVTLRAGELTMSVARTGRPDAAYSFGGNRLTQSVSRLSGYVKSADGARHMCEHLSLTVGEQVYGLGERFTSFVKNGQVIDIWNEDGGTSSELAYKNVPLYLTNRGYGVLVANSGRVSFEVASEVVTSVQFSVPGEVLEYYVIGGGNPKQVLSNYAKLAGRPALPPAWSFGLWLSTSFTTEYNEETVNSFVNGMEERKIPLRVFHFDCFWMKEFQWVDLEWDTAQFPDPEAMLSRLKSRGLKICVWINPYVAQKSRLFDEGMTKGYLVKKPDGSVWQWDRWQAGMALVDFTNPEAVAWYQGALKRLIDVGVDTFKTDFGERIPTDVVYSNNADPERMHNFYTYLYNKSVFELLEREKGKTEAVVFARSATVGSQKYPVHWGGDCSATYESMAETLRGGLSLALSGFGFWSHDIGGFEQTATPDLFKRWVAFGALSSHSRLHGNESYRVPWSFDDEASDVLRHFIRLKFRLMPYLYSAACQASFAGIPMMRPMLLEFPDDRTCPNLDRQYMLGDSLLVAPIFEETGIVEYYVPDGRWTSFLSGDRVQGGRWLREHHDYLSLPLLVRPNSIIAVGSVEDRPDYDYCADTTFHLYEIEEGGEAAAHLCGQNGTSEVSVVARRSNRSIEVETTGAAKAWSVCLRGIQEVSSADGGSVTATPQGVVIKAAEAGRRITARF